VSDFDYATEWREWQQMPIADYEAAVLAATRDEIGYWVVGEPDATGRTIAEPPRLEGSHPTTEIVVVMWDDSVGTYERRYRIWRDDRHSRGTEVPPPGIRLAPSSIALGVAQDLHS
jgi:hypothetical protein